MRLIDADAFVEYVNRMYDLCSDELRMMIEEQPTAYNVDKVVAELENVKLIRVEQCHDDYEIEVMTSNNFDEAIDIVGKGGVE